MGYQVGEACSFMVEHVFFMGEHLVRELKSTWN